MADSLVAEAPPTGKKVSTDICDDIDSSDCPSSLGIETDSLEAANDILINLPVDTNNKDPFSIITNEDEGQSLQELIESEFALRINSNNDKEEFGFQEIMHFNGDHSSQDSARSSLGEDLAEIIDLVPHYSEPNQSCPYVGSTSSSTSSISEDNKEDFNLEAKVADIEQLEPLMAIATETQCPAFLNLQQELQLASNDLITEQPQEFSDDFVNISDPIDNLVQVKEILNQDDWSSSDSENEVHTVESNTVESQLITHDDLLTNNPCEQLATQSHMSPDIFEIASENNQQIIPLCVDVVVDNDTNINNPFEDEIPDPVLEEQLEEDLDQPILVENVEMLSPIKELDSPQTPTSQEEIENLLYQEEFETPLYQEEIIAEEMELLQQLQNEQLLNVAMEEEIVLQHHDMQIPIEQEIVLSEAIDLEDQLVPEVVQPRIDEYIADISDTSSSDQEEPNSVQHVGMKPEEGTFYALHAESNPSSSAASESDSSDSEHHSKGENKERKPKKKCADGEVKDKKKKKSKKAETEKENISMHTNGYINGKVLIHSDDSDIYTNGLIDEDRSIINVKLMKCDYLNTANKPTKPPTEDISIDTGVSLAELRNTYTIVAQSQIKEVSEKLKENFDTGVSIKNLKTVYSTEAQKEKEIKRELASEELVGISLKSLKEAYCSQAAKSVNGDSIDSPKEEVVISTTPIHQLRSSFSKFDQLTKKTVLHVRSFQQDKLQQQFSQENFPLYALLDTHDCACEKDDTGNNCKMCNKQVFQMEQIKAEKSLWHKNCFRCQECQKQLNVDTYSSHEGLLYCKPHFKELFKPKAVIDNEDEPVRRRKPEPLIRENQPVELPPDVVRACDKPDYGLEELSNLNVKSRYQVFEKPGDENNLDHSSSTVSVKRSASILSRLAKFQAKGMDIGVTDDSLNGVPPYEESSNSSSEEELEENGVENGEENGYVIKSRRKLKERPVSFGKMDDIRSKWETGVADKKEELTKERKDELQKFRTLLCMGKQGKLKEKYEQAVMDQDSLTSPKKESMDIQYNDKAKSIREKFERGEVIPSDEEDDENKREEDEEVFETGVSKESRNIFMQLDATASKSNGSIKHTQKAATNQKIHREIIFKPHISEEIVRSSDVIEDAQVDTSNICNKFKFFETYKEPEKQRKTFRITPPREGQVKEKSPELDVYRDPTVVRADDKIEEEIFHSNTTSKVLSMFRQMEEKKEDVTDGPKPLKRFTPPPEGIHDEESSEEESDSEDEESGSEEESGEEQNTNLVRASDKIEDEFLKQNTARAKTLRAKFEKWESTVEKENEINLSQQEEVTPSLDTAKNLRAKFEALKQQESMKPQEKSKVKVNRFVKYSTSEDESAIA